ncbi:sialin [Dermatophagoides farinae]|uniref:Sialin-like protein 6 n=1 Tax=Dermatophagoides farinae TaxID=6954 RepID=A0A9D4NUX5_DERFA|nr:sialin-like [Dermatophagoides farinae]KAH7639660.1 sialin-like protein 6 [Dermatophagoides farinae]
MLTIQRKWIISMLGIYSCGLMYVVRAGISVAMVRMTMVKNENDNLSNSSSSSISSNAPTFDWNETLQGIILGGIFYLYWIVPTIVGSLIERYGAKWFAFIGVIGPCILTAITPWIATVNVYLLIVVMILVGVTQAFTYPALFHLYVRWFPPEELSKANSGIQVGASLGGIIIYSIGGYLCETTIGWPLVFYVSAATHIPWLFLWLYFGSDHPDKHMDNDINMKSSSSSSMMNENQKNKKIRTPWLAILKSGAVWSSQLSKFACSYGFYMLMSKIPAYLDRLYNINIVDNGFICAAAFASYGLSCFIAPYISNWMIDRLNISVLTTRKLFQAVAMLIPCICLLAITFVYDKTIMIILLIMAMLSYGFFTGGEWTMISEYAPNFVGVVSGFIHILGFMSGFLAPYIVGVILDSNIGDERFKWNVAFWISAALYFIGYLAFWFLCTVEQQNWDKI